MHIEQPHGYLRDSDGLVVVRFGNWKIGDHQVPDAVKTVDYVDSPIAHQEPVAEKYRNES